MDEKIICYSTDHIEVLGLSVRVHNALRRAQYWDVGEVIVLNDDQLFAVRNLGEKGVAEVRERLGRIQLLDATPVVHEIASIDELSEHPQILLDFGPPSVAKHEVVEWQQMMVKRQIEARLLHPQIEIDGQELSELVDSHVRSFGLYERLVMILTAPITVSQELEELLKSVPPREIEILIRRYGFERQTLEEIASYIEVTRERVRQLEKQAIMRVQNAASGLQFVRVQSALLFADNADLSHELWTDQLSSTGLRGEWCSGTLAGFDPIELMIALLQSKSDLKPAVGLPESLKLMLQLHSEGRSATPARTLYYARQSTPQLNTLLRRQQSHSGAVNLDWYLDNDYSSLERHEFQQVVIALGFEAIGGGWHIRLDEDMMPESAHKAHVFHNSLFKMFAFCGPLESRDIVFGLEHALSKTNYPLLSAPLLEFVLKSYGYSLADKGWFWDGSMKMQLNNGERIIMKALKENQWVAHHSQLARAFTESPRSFALLHGTLRRSPLFDRFGQALYKLRGTHPNAEAVEVARQHAAKIPVDLKFEYDMEGNIILEANISAMALGNGTVVASRLPNIAGEWKCTVCGTEAGSSTVTDGEIRGLRCSMQTLDCEIGDRIRMTFNTDTGIVSVSHAGDIE